MKQLKKKRTAIYHIMLILPVIFVLIFNYAPMFGIMLAFKEYKPGLGIWGSPWVGFEQFEKLIQMQGFTSAVWNTFKIATLKTVLGLIVPVVFALLLNEVKNQFFKKTVQTITFIPYFLSWVVLGGILIEFLSPSSGLLNSILNSLGFESVFFLGKPEIFPATIITTDLWKNMGYSSIVYLAALAGLDDNLYEAAQIDGAGRWKQTLYVTLPGIAPIIALMTVLSIGNVLNAGFDQIFNLYNPAVYSTGDVIDTLVYRLGMEQQQYSLSTAVGLFKSVISGILIVISYKLANKYTGYRVF